METQNKEFLITFADNKRESIIYIAEYDGDKVIRHDVDKPTVAVSEEDQKKIDGYLSLYTGLNDDEIAEGKEKIIEKLCYHQWILAAKAKLAVLESEAGIIHNKETK